MFVATSNLHDSILIKIHYLLNLHEMLAFLEEVILGKFMQKHTDSNEEYEWRKVHFLFEQFTSYPFCSITDMQRTKMS